MNVGLNEFFKFFIRDKSVGGGTRFGEIGLVLTNPGLFLADKAIDQKFGV